MRISIWQLLSKSFLVAAIATFAAFHFILDPGLNNEPGWNVWKGLWELALDPTGMSEPMGWIAVATFLTASLLIIVSPFLGTVWIKSKMAWLLTVIFSGFSAGGFAVAMFIGRSTSDVDIELGLQLLLAAPVLNFIGLLFARVGAPKPDKPQWMSAVPPSISEGV